MNIVLACPQFFPEAYGGVETYTLALATEYQRLNHTVRVVCTRRNASGLTSVTSQEEEFQGIPVWRINYSPLSRPPRFKQILYDPEIAEQVGQALREWKVDIIHVTNFSGVSAAVIPVAKQAGIPVVWTATDFGMTCARYILLKWDGSLCPGPATFHGCLDCVRPRSQRSTQLYNSLAKLPPKVSYQLAKLIQKIPFKIHGLFESILIMHQRLDTLLPLLQQIDLIIAPSTWMKEILVMNGADPRRIVVSVYGLDTNHTAHSLPIPNSPLRFGFLGRIHSMKGVDVLIDAFNQLSTSNGATLTIYGSPSPDQFEYAGRLWSMAKNNPSIVFGNQINPDELSSVFNEFDVMIVPSMWYENSPIAILEAFYHKTPVIASEVAGMTDVIRHEVNGLLFQRGDASDLAIQMQRFIDKPELVRQLSRQIQTVKDIHQDAKMLLAKYEMLTQIAIS